MANDGASVVANTIPSGVFLELVRMATVMTIPPSPNAAHMNKSNKTIAQNSKGMIVTKTKRNTLRPQVSR
jgi:hypothetical protein